MKLFVFQCGCIKTKKHLLADVPMSDNIFEVPVPFFLIEHSEGNVLFDAGQPISAIGHAVDDDFIPVMNDNDYVAAQLKILDLQLSDITHIVLSHLHNDHAGGLEAFADSEAICYLHKNELTHAVNRDVLEKYALRWRLLDGRLESSHDIFGDGKLKIVFTPGHTLGHQSLLLDLENSGRILLAADSVYLDEILDADTLPANFVNHQATMRTIEMIKKIKRSGVKIITGHDPAGWAKLKLVPKYYC